VEAAYRRSDLFHKRAVLMEEWSGFFCGVSVMEPRAGLIA
jgi:hypothetical protein